MCHNLNGPRGALPAANVRPRPCIRINPPNHQICDGSPIRIPCLSHIDHYSSCNQPDRNVPSPVTASIPPCAPRSDGSLGQFDPIEEQAARRDNSAILHFSPSSKSPGQADDQIPRGDAAMKIRTANQTNPPNNTGNPTERTHRAGGDPDRTKPLLPATQSTERTHHAALDV